jgi:hypothetical protein
MMDVLSKPNKLQTTSSYNVKTGAKDVSLVRPPSTSLSLLIPFQALVISKNLCQKVSDFGLHFRPNMMILKFASFRSRYQTSGSSMPFQKRARTRQMGHELLRKGLGIA